MIKGLALLVMAASLLLTPLGWTEAGAANAGAVYADFADVFSADLAGDRDGLWLAVAGTTRGMQAGEHRVGVYMRGRGSGWRRTPPLRGLLALGNPVSLTDRKPCVGFERRPRGRVLACLRGGQWRGAPTNGLPGRSARLLKLWSVRRGLWAAFTDRQRIAVMRLSNGRWRAVGVPLPTGRAIAAVGERPGPSGAIDVALADVATGDRVVWSLTRGRWHPHPKLRRAGGGPAPGGPVRLGTSIYLPVIDAFAEPWALSVRVLDRGEWGGLGAPLNRGTGHAQGVVRALGSSIWASWQENEPRDDGLFNTNVYVQQVAPTLTEAMELWMGTSIGPGSVEVVQAAGKRWVLYMPAAGRRALTVSVDPFG